LFQSTSRDNIPVATIHLSTLSNDANSDILQALHDPTVSPGRTPDFRLDIGLGVMRMLSSAAGTEGQMRQQR